MSRASLAWLHRELPKLVAAGVLTPEGAEALRRHYGPAEDRGFGRRLATALLAVLGTLLVGGGVVLLLAHNWDDLSRAARAFLLIALLVAAQGLAGFALLRRAASAAWREAAGSLQVAAVAAAVALVAQTYHVPGDLAGYYRTVLLLALPLVYLLDAAAVGVLTWAGLVAFATSSGRHETDVLLWWLLAAAGVPFLVRLARREGRTWRTALTIVTAVAALFVGGTINAGRSEWDGLWALYGLAVLAIAHALGSLREEDDAPWRRRLRLPAYVALVVLGLLLTYRWPWQPVADGVSVAAGAGVWATAAVALCLGAWATWYAVHLLRVRQWHLGAVSLAWVAGALAYILALAAQEPSARLLCNLWLAAVGITGLAEGFREGRIVRANAGLLALAALAVARFFDAEVSFLVRGLVFIGVGMGFLAVNLLLVRRARPRLPSLS